MERAPKLYSAQDATNASAYIQLLRAVYAAPSLVPKPQPAHPSKGRLYLVRFHESAAASSSCYITRLPMNLIRTLATYNTLVDLLGLAMTCKHFSRILKDKYIVGTDRVEYQDLLDANRMRELTSSQDLRVKIYEIVKLRIVHINSATHSFYALDTHTILEGVFVRCNDSFEVLKSRPNIEDVSAVDVAGDIIACANTCQLALSQPAHKLRIAPLDSQPTVALRFLGEKTLIVVLRSIAIQVFSVSLMALHNIQVNCALNLLYVPNVEKSVFATVDSTSTVSSYAIKGMQCVQLYSGRPLLDTEIQAIWMLREVYADAKVDFLIVWFSAGLVTVNDVDLGNYRYVRLQEKTLICLSSNVKIFGIDAKTRQFRLERTLQLHNFSVRPSHVILWKHKAVFIGPDCIVWATLREDIFLPASRNNIQSCTPESVWVYGNYLLVQGKFCGKLGVDVGWCAVTNFAANAMIDRTRIVEEAEKEATFYSHSNPNT